MRQGGGWRQHVDGGVRGTRGGREEERERGEYKGREEAMMLAVRERQ